MQSCENQARVQDFLVGGPFCIWGKGGGGGGGGGEEVLLLREGRYA